MCGFEKDLRVSLPEQYREFLLHLGNGGAGPYYGIFKLAGKDPEDITDYGMLHQAFPWKKKVARPRLESIPGALYICNYGCALRFFLVVNGPCCGEVWQDWRADGEGVFPVTSKTGERLQFLDWYLAWLNGKVGRS